jgi:hypothetical protein
MPSQRISRIDVIRYRIMGCHFGSRPDWQGCQIRWQTKPLSAADGHGEPWVAGVGTSPVGRAGDQRPRRIPAPPGRAVGRCSACACTPTVLRVGSSCSRVLFPCADYIGNPLPWQSEFAQQLADAGLGLGRIYQRRREESREIHGAEVAEGCCGHVSVDVCAAGDSRRVATNHGGDRERNWRRVPRRRQSVL